MADDKKRIDQPTGTETVGHEWDGIEELNTPLPRWWLWAFYASIGVGVAYTIFYPAWPLVSEATAGVLNWSSRGQLDQHLAVPGRRFGDFHVFQAPTFENLFLPLLI